MFHGGPGLAGKSGRAEAILSSSTFGALGDDSKWDGGVVTSEGKVVGIPFDSREVLLIDPEARTVELFGDLAAANSRWSGGVATLDGKVLGVPGDADQILLIDPETRSTELFGDLQGEDKWYGGVATSDGKAVGIPYDSQHVLLVDPILR